MSAAVATIRYIGIRLLETAIPYVAEAAMEWLRDRKAEEAPKAKIILDVNVQTGPVAVPDCDEDDD